MSAKKHILFFVVILGLTVAHGQTLTFAPTGAKWTFGVGFVFSSTIEYREWISQGDTLIGGHNCKIIKRSGTPVVGDISDTIIAYEDSNKVYWHNKFFNQFTVLYDFSKNAGGSWTMKTDSCDLLITVDSTGMETINGFPLKVLYISSQNNTFNGKVLQHIGHIQQPNPDITSSCYGLIIDYNYYAGLRCYEDSVFGFHDFGIAPSCDFTTPVNDISKNINQIKVFPNPFFAQTTLRTDNLFKNATLTVYNSFGQEVKQIINISGQSITLNRDNLPSGLYFIRLTQENKTLATGKLIITDN